MAGNIFAGYSKSPIHPNLPSSAGGNTAQGTGSTHHKPKQQKPKQGKPHKPAKPKTPNPMGRGPLNALNYDAPLDYPTAVKLSQALGGLQYDSQIGQLKGLRSNIPNYFNDYRQRLANAQTQTTQLSQPLLDQAGQVAQNTGQTLGLSGPAAGNDALAAASRAQQAGAMAQALQGIANANSNYYTQTGANSYGAQTTADQQLGQQIAGLKGERGNAILSNLLNLRNTDRNYNLEVKTLLGNQAADRAKARNDAAATRAATRKSQNDFLAKNGVSQSTWRHMTPKERVAWKREWSRSQQSPTDKLNTARLKYFRQHGYFPPTGPGGGANGKDQFGNTQRQRDSANSAWKKARAVAGQISKPGDNWKTVYKLMLGSSSGVSNVNSDVLTVAAMRATGTKIPKSLMRSLRRQGVDVAQIRNPAGGKPARTGATGNQAPGANGQTRPT